MSAPAFTPGPWHEHSHRQIGPSRGIVCEVWSAIGETSDDAIAQADANCRLIAAAPELYAVACTAEALLTRQKWRPDPYSTEGSLLRALRTVLAKVSQGGAS